MMVNETALKLMKEKNPIGKKVNWNGNKLKIIGVVKDFNFCSPQVKFLQWCFFISKQLDWMIGNVNNIYVKVNPENMEKTIADIEKFWTKNVDSEYPFQL